MGFMNWELHEYPLLPITNFHTWTVRSATKMEVPRFVIIGFQVRRKNRPNVNASHFDHCKLADMKLYLNGVQYPYDNVRADFDKNTITFTPCIAIFNKRTMENVMNRFSVDLTIN